MVTSTVWPEVKKKKKMVPAFAKMPFEKTVKILEILAYNHVYFFARGLIQERGQINKHTTIFQRLHSRRP